MDKESVEQIRPTGDAAGQNQPNDQKTDDDRSKREEQPAASDDYSKIAIKIRKRRKLVNAR